MFEFSHKRDRYIRVGVCDLCKISHKRDFAAHSKENSYAIPAKPDMTCSEVRSGERPSRPVAGRRCRGSKEQRGSILRYMAIGRMTFLLAFECVMLYFSVVRNEALQCD